MNNYATAMRELFEETKTKGLAIEPYDVVKKNLDKAARDTHKKMVKIIEDIMRFGDEE